MRISDWSSDVCSSDLRAGILWQKRDGLGLLEVVEALAECFASSRESRLVDSACTIGDERRQYVETRVIQDPVPDGKQEDADRERTSVVKGQGETVRVTLGVGRIIKK